MSYATLKADAERLLHLAATYAGDGAIETAILKANQALVRLRQAKTDKAALLNGLATGGPTKLPAPRRTNV